MGQNLGENLNYYIWKNCSSRVYNISFVAFSFVDSFSFLLTITSDWLFYNDGLIVFFFWVVLFLYSASSMFLFRISFCDTIRAVIRLLCVDAWRGSSLLSIGVISPLCVYFWLQFQFFSFCDLSRIKVELILSEIAYFFCAFSENDDGLLFLRW